MVKSCPAAKVTSINSTSYKVILIQRCPIGRFELKFSMMSSLKGPLRLDIMLNFNKSKVAKYFRSHFRIEHL